jgi:hypothetical protein
MKPTQVPLLVHYDLVISNYAFSECSTELQRDYIERILSKSRNGYMICNQLGTFDHGRMRSYTPDEIKSKLRESGIPFQVMGEKPLTHDLNYLIVWNNHQNRS